MIQLAAFDMDGTLLEKATRRTPESAIYALKELKQKGIILVLASGRTITTLDESVMSRVEFDYIMCGNGTYLVDSRHNLLFKSEFSKQLVLELITDFKHCQGGLNIRYGEGSHTFCGMEFLKSYTEKFLGKDNHATDNYYKFDYENSIPMSALCYIPSERYSYFLQKYEQLVFVHAGVDNYYDVTRNEDNKGNTLMRLCSVLDVPIKNTIAFGDDVNDIPMLECAGIGIAMGNATELAKQAADYVTDDCMNDGIEKACMHLGIL